MGAVQDGGQGGAVGFAGGEEAEAHGVVPF